MPCCGEGEGSATVVAGKDVHPALVAPFGAYLLGELGAGSFYNIVESDALAEYPALDVADFL